MTPAGATPDVTVVITTRDRHESLMQTFTSVRAQQNVSVQVVIVDDGSIDGTPELVESGACREVTLIRHDRPQGVAVARNAGIERAKAPWVALVDDDDLWSPRKLSEQLSTAARENRQWVYSSVLIVDQGLVPLLLARAADPDSLLTQLLRSNVLAGGASNVCMRTQLLESTGGFDARFSQLADWDLWIRLASVARAARCESVHTAYVLHAGNMVLGAPDEPARELAQLADKHAGLCRLHRTTPSRAVLAQWVAARHRLAGRRLTAARLYAASSIRDHDLANLARAVTTATRIDHTIARRRHDRPVTPAWLDDARSVL